MPGEQAMEIVARLEAARVRTLKFFDLGPELADQTGARKNWRLGY
jgi:hypothetical protein